MSYSRAVSTAAAITLGLLLALILASAATAAEVHGVGVPALPEAAP